MPEIIAINIESEDNSKITLLVMLPYALESTKPITQPLGNPYQLSVTFPSPPRGR